MSSAKKFDAIIESIKKEFGKDSVMVFGQDDNTDIDSITTGNKNIDDIIGVGGIPRGKITELYGNESSGKTTLALHVIAEVQKQGGIASFIDAEHALDPQYAKNLGVDLTRLIFHQPDSGEQALSMVEHLVKTKKIDIVVVDSVAALVPLDELKGDMDDKQIGVQARMMGKALRRLTHDIKDSNTIVLFINQVREKIGIMFGEKTTTPGGRALKFWAHLRLHMTKVRTVKKGTTKIANLVKVVVKKSKVSTPFKECTVTIEYGKGIVDDN